MRVNVKAFSLGCPGMCVKVACLDLLLFPPAGTYKYITCWQKVSFPADHYYIVKWKSARNQQKYLYPLRFSACPVPKDYQCVY